MITSLPVAIAVAILSFILFRSLYLRTKKPSVHSACVFTASLLAIPPVLFLSNYLLHIPNSIWFINFHSLPGAEASSGLIGALLGVMFASSRLRSRQPSTSVLRISTVIAVMLLIAPFGKQLFFRQDYSKLGNSWVNGVCEQTSSSTCVAASCATVVRMLGGNLTERELAKEAGSNRRGTEIWYMIRAIRRHGYEIEPRYAKSVKDVPTPAVLGVKIGGAGHVVVLMSESDAGPEIGNPFQGRRGHYTWEAFERRYHPEPIYYVIRPVKS